MAERKAFQARTNEIQAPPSSRVPNAAAAELEEFGQRLQGLGQKLHENWLGEQERAEALSGAKAGATGAFTPRRTGERPDEAYDRAGLESYFEKLKIQTSDEVDRIWRENQSDPAKLESSLAGYRDGIAAELTKSTPELLPHFDAAFDRSSRGYRRQAAADYDQNQRLKRSGDLEEFLANKELQDESRAVAADGTPDGIADVALNRQEYIEALNNLGPEQNGGTGRYNALEVQDRLNKYDRMIVRSKTFGEFKRSQKAGRGDTFVKNFADKGWQGAFSLAERGQLVNLMEGELSAGRAQAAAAQVALAGKVKAASDALWSGEAPGGLAGLRAQVAGTEFEADLNRAMNNQDLMAKVKQMTPAGVDMAIVSERAALESLDPSDKTYADEVDMSRRRIARMEQTRDANAKAINDDPFGWGVEVGLVEAPPLLTQEGVLNPAALAERVESAEILTAYTGRETPPLAKGEAADLARGLAGDPDIVLDDRTRAAMRRAVKLIAPDHPQIAQITTFAMNDRRSPSDGASVSNLLQRGYQLTQTVEGKPPIFKLKTGAEGKQAFDQSFSAYVGDAFMGDASARQAAQDGLFAVYAAYAENAPDGLAGGFDDKTFKSAAAAYFGGSKARINGGDAFAPYGMAADEFELGLRADAAVRLRATGIYQPAQIDALVRNAAPQNVDDGYALLVGDSYVVGADGAPLKFYPKQVPRDALADERLVQQAIERQSEAR